MKRFAVQFLCLLLVLSMGIVFAACDDTPLPSPDIKDETPTPAGGDETTYTEEDAKVALTNMTTKLADQKNYSLATTLEITLKAGLETHIYSVPMVLSVDEDANMSAKLTIPEGLRPYLGCAQLEAYLTDTGVYLGTDGAVVDEEGNPVLSFDSTDMITTGTFAELQALVDRLFAIIDGATLPEDAPATYDVATDASPLPLPDVSLSVPATSLALTGIAEGGYLLTATADMTIALNSALQSLTQALAFNPNEWLRENYGTELPEILATYGEMQMADLLDALDAQLGKETVDELLTVIAEYLPGDDTADGLANDDAADALPPTPADDLRAMILDMAGEIKLVELVAAYWPFGEFPTYDAEAADQNEYYEALAEYLVALVPDTAIGELPIGDATLADLVESITVLGCKASVAFTLSETYLPTACAVEADASVMYHEDPTDLLKTKFYSLNVKATADLSFDKAVSLPTLVLLQPRITSYGYSYDGEAWDCDFTVWGNGFTVTNVVATQNGDAIENCEYTAETDPDSGMTYVTLQIPLNAGSADSADSADSVSAASPVVSIELTYEASDGALYKAMLRIEI